KFPDRIEFIKGDVRTDMELLAKAVAKADHVLHLAAQVAVTTSVKDPREDFEINAFGTFNVLEAVRNSKNRPSLIYASTNKVYGGMEDLIIVERNNRYQYKDLVRGITEERPLDFHSPYGCSKGCGDQYVRDYSRIYGLDTVVFRQSCIYGPRQFGVEDQGWVAWFIIAATLSKDVTIYGDGKQVRDVLYVKDLVEAYDMVFNNMKKISGNVYNVGGSHTNQMSLLELIDILKRDVNKDLKIDYSEWRPGDQKVCVMDVSLAEKDFGWTPKTSVHEGVKKLCSWVANNKNLFTYFK
ncbi:MAG: GDP-mannose 4,6-dehydratase, partial [Candidatus Woesearchaeota archaeon]